MSSIDTENAKNEVLLREVSNGSTTNQNVDENLPDAPEAIPDSEYMSGWKLHVNTFALGIAIFSAQMEQSIVSTSVLAITNQLGSFHKSGWIFTAYLLSYTGLMMIWAKLTDIFGRKPPLLASIIIFIAFSAACAASQTLVQLIVFRSLQGIGGSGIFSLVILIFLEFVPTRKLPLYTALVTFILMFSVTFGPLIGGAINNHTTWRWIFWLNVPICAISLVLLTLLLPKSFPGQHKTAKTQTTSQNTWLEALTQRVDILGATLLLGACVLLVAAMEEASEGYSFASSLVLPMLIIAGVLLVGFLAWQRYIAGRELPESVFPWELLSSRIYMGMILNTFFTGSLLTVLTIVIPQRFQTVNGESSFAAGVRLIAFGLLAPFGSTISALFIMKVNIPPIYILFLGGFLEIAGTVGLSKTPTTYNIWPAQYAFQVITGLGVGCFNALLMLLVPVVVRKKELAVGSAAITQFRVLGGTIAIAIVISAMNRVIRSDLLQVLSPKQVQEVLDTTSVIRTFPQEVQATVREIFGRGYNLQMKIMIGFAVAQIPSTLLMWTKKPTMIPRK